MGFYPFKGERLPIKKEMGTENQKDTWTTGSFSGRKFLIKSSYDMRNWELIPTILPVLILRTAGMGMMNVRKLWKDEMNKGGCRLFK